MGHGLVENYMKNLFKLSVASLIIFFSFVFSSSVFAATPSTTTTTPQKVTLVATVNIQDAKIISQDGNIFNISFNLTNGKIVQPGVRYGLNLIKVDGKGQHVVDEKIYDEVLSLSANSKVTKEIIYTAPTYISGEYTILLISKTESGMPLALNPVAKIKLTATEKNVVIYPESCYLTIQGEASGKKYLLSQGVDVLEKEPLYINCMVFNGTTDNVSVDPFFTTNYRSSYGDVVETPKSENKTIFLSINEKKNISVKIPVNNKET